jgi:hypothetical protein
MSLIPDCRGKIRWTESCVRACECEREKRDENEDFLPQHNDWPTPRHLIHFCVHPKKREKPESPESRTEFMLIANQMQTFHE